MRFSGTIAAIPALGLAAALGAHQTLLALATAHIAAPSYGAHAHDSVASAFIVECVLLLLLAVAGVREALRPDRDFSRPVASPSVIVAAVGIAACAVATLFCMEYSESGTAALGLGWIGDQAGPGIAVLATAIAGVCAAFVAFACGRMAAFDRLVALFFALVAVVASIVRRATAATPRAALPLRRDPPCARHASLRAPPIPTI